LDQRLALRDLAEITDTDTVIKIELTYPLDKPTTKEFRKDSGPWQSSNAC
jgi:hypothetical protein